VPVLLVACLKPRKKRPDQGITYPEVRKIATSNINNVNKHLDNLLSWLGRPKHPSRLSRRSRADADILIGSSLLKSTAGVHS